MSQRQRPAEFIDMPLELSERIAYLLDLNTILSLRCVCPSKLPFHKVSQS
jgi:hypothetical protein